MTTEACSIGLRLRCLSICMTAACWLGVFSQLQAAPASAREESGGNRSALADRFVADVVLCERLKAENAFLAREVQRIQTVRQTGSPDRNLLDELKVVNPATRQALASVVQENSRAVLEGLDAAIKRLNGQTDELQQQWRAVRGEIAERRILLFEVQGSRRMSGQLVWLLSVDNRWFWLGGVVAIACLFGVVLHDRRHEIRRRLNGGRARAMRLSEFLGAALVVLMLITVATFVMGDQIYQSLAAVSSGGIPSPHYVMAAENAEVRQQAAELQAARDAIAPKHAEVETAWRELLKDVLPEGSTVAWQWREFREKILQIHALCALLENLPPCVAGDLKTLAELNAELGENTGATVRLFRLKQWIRTVLGVALVGLTAFGGALFYRGVQSRRALAAATCPLCLGVNKLDPVIPPGGLDPQAAPGSTILRCRNAISRKPYEECDYRFMAAYRGLGKLCFPTLGIPQAGKTHWLAMLYSELNRGNYPKTVQFERTRSHVSGDFDQIVEEILNARIGTAATQRERIPHPLVFNFQDHDRLGRSNILVNIFDYSGEVTSDMGVDDYRRRRALEADGFFFFLDPTFPSEPQAKALADFREDLRLIRGLKPGKRTRTPVALCLTKIDMLAAKSYALPDGGDAIEHFYRELGEVDPTGEAMTTKIIRGRSRATARLREVIWPGWQIERQIAELFGGRYMFFPLTPIGLDGRGESDLSARTISPFGLLEPLVWLLQMNGYPILEG